MAPKPKPTTTTKARSSAAPKPKSTKSSTKARKALSPSPTPSLDSPPAALGLDKALVLRIILAKLEASKTCDWYELSLKLNKDADGGKAGDAKGKDKAKGRKKGSDDEHKGRGLSGSELYDLYHYKILPGLKAGRALWIDDETARNVTKLPGMTATASALIGEEVDMFGDDDDDVAKKMASTSTARTAIALSPAVTKTRSNGYTNGDSTSKPAIDTIVDENEDEYEGEEDQDGEEEGEYAAFPDAEEGDNNEEDGDYGDDHGDGDAGSDAETEVNATTDVSV